LVSDQAADAKADAKKAMKVRKQAQIEASEEEKKRVSLMKKAE